MSGQLFKAHSSRVLPEEKRNQLKLRAMMRGIHGIQDCIDMTQEHLLDDARENLVVKGKEHHLLNLYLNLSDDFSEVECVWVFDDRNTALMFKLALP